MKERAENELHFSLALRERSMMAPKRMATSSPPESKTAEVAAAGRPAHAFAVWSSCSSRSSSIICFIIVAGLFYCCCAPPAALAGESMPWVLRNMISSWGNDELKEHHRLVAPKLQKEEWSHVDSLYPEARAELSVVNLPIPYFLGDLAFEKAEFNSDTADLVILDHFFESGPMRDEAERATFHLEMMTDIMKFLRQHLSENKRLPRAKFLAEETKRILAKRDDRDCGITMAARVNDDNSRLAAVIQEDSDSNVNVRLSLPKPTPIKRAPRYGPKVVSWEYSTSFKLVSNRLTPIKDSLKVEEKGDPDKRGTTGKWTIIQKIDRSCDDTNWELPTSHYYWNMKCSNVSDQTLPGYEYTWNTEFVGFDIVKESFVGKSPIYQNNKPITDSESSIAKPKSRSLLLTREYDPSEVALRRALAEDGIYPSASANSCDLVEKFVEMTDGWKVHDYYMRKTYYDMNIITSWTGVALSEVGQDISISLDGIPLNFHHHSGMLRTTKQLQGEHPWREWVLAPQTCMRYAITKTKPSKWSAATCLFSHLPARTKNIPRNFSYTSKDLKAFAASSKAFTKSSCPPQVESLNYIFTCPIQREKDITLPKKKDENCQLLGNPSENFDQKSSITNCKHIVFNGTLLFCIALSLFVLTKLLKCSAKSGKEHQ